MKTELKTTFFLQNLLKATDRKNFETITTLPTNNKDIYKRK